ncbi:BTAD domain-containing putative transcriptional regulator [Maribacter sp. 4G9]|uniref:BTAD domain-containing putative transcriptional regulator n=1 Tax=Maribacter sp. 4G9 TaxID=1889777 RepID=UPI000C3D771B|nr:BTAD domain-containing putative transcriptional regulator [Maribacter sp. 4G9]PIB39501.1 response regulator receiver protein [Maribacter sp. 4G9]
MIKGDINVHVGFFFQKEGDQWVGIRQVLGQYNNWLYITDQYKVSDIECTLKPKNEALPKGVVFPSSDFFLRERVLRAKPFIEALRNKISETDFLKGKKTVILFEMTWAVRTPSGDIYLREFHEELQMFLSSEKNKVDLVCLYNESVLLDEQLLLGLFVHPKIFTSKKIKSNPYYLPIHIVKNNRIKQRFDYWLSKVDGIRKKSDGSNVGSKEASAKKNFASQNIINTADAQSEEGRWKIRCFGELRIRRENGELIDWNTKSGATKKLKTVFAFLLVRGIKGAKTEELADLLWPYAEDTEQALNRLYHAIRYLRMVLSKDGKASKDSPFIVNQNSIYYLNLPHDSWIDLPMFQELCHKGNSHFKGGNIDQAKICYEAAERLYTGDLFEDIPMKYIEGVENDWCWGKRVWFKEMYHKLMCNLAEIYRMEGDFSVSLGYCDKVLSEDALQESALKERLLTLAAAKRFDAVERQYKIYLKTLDKFEMGRPSKEIYELYINLLVKK